MIPVDARLTSAEAAILSDREVIRSRYGGDLFTISVEDDELLSSFLDDLFVRDRAGKPKGIVVVRLK